MTKMLNSVVQRVPVEKLAAHVRHRAWACFVQPSHDLTALQNHDTFGMGIANVMSAINAGVRVVDSSGQHVRRVTTDTFHSFVIGQWLGSAAVLIHLVRRAMSPQRCVWVSRAGRPGICLLANCLL